MSLNGRRRKEPRLSELPCEYASREILPSIRAALVRYLVEEKGFSKYKVAKMLGITPASVTYYIKGARGNPALQAKLLSPPHKALIASMAEMIIRAYQEGVSREFYTRYKGLVCRICAGFNPVAQEYGCAQ